MNTLFNESDKYFFIFFHIQFIIKFLNVLQIIKYNDIENYIKLNLEKINWNTVTILWTKYEQLRNS